MDTRRLIKAAEAGQAFAFFPEGTFKPTPGIGKFHTGAFVIAARAGLPIAPIAIRGTRHMLPGGRVLPRFSQLQIDVLPPLHARSKRPPAAIAQAMRDEARARIVAALDEPDVAEIDGVDALARRHKTQPSARGSRP